MKTKLFAWVSSIAFLVSAISEWGLDIDLPLTPALWLVMTAVVLCATNAPAALTTNSWTSSLPGNWHDPFSWSAGVPSNNQALVRIANSGSKVVLISSATATVPGTMTISNLLVSASVGSTNGLQMFSSGTTVPLRVLNSVTIMNGGELLVTNAVLQVDGLSGGELAIDGSVNNLAGGHIVATNVTTIIGKTTRGNFVTIGGTFLATNVTVGQSSGSQGTLTLAGGTNLVSDSLVLGHLFTATGAVWVTGGVLAVTNFGGLFTIGDGGVGQMTVSNGTVALRQLQVGSSAGSQGTLTVAGGTNTFNISVSVANGPNSTGVVWVTGGLFHCLGGIDVGLAGTGNMTISNGTFLSGGDINIAPQSGSRGTLTIAGGLLEMTDTSVQVLTVGGAGGSATGTLWLTGGQLTVTNGDFTVGNFGTGLMTMSNGLVFANNLIVSAGVGRGTFTMSGGTNTVSGNFKVGTVAGSDGTVWMTGSSARLVTTNGITTIGEYGMGRLAVSNGTLLARSVLVASNATASGTLTIAGGTAALTGPLVVGQLGGSTGSVVVTGGQLVITNNPALVGAGSGFVVDGSAIVTNGSSIIVSNVSTIIGNVGGGSLTDAGGMLAATNLIVGNFAGSVGTLALNAGTTTVPGTMILGNFGCSSTGIVNIAGGSLYVTNAGASAVLDVRSGTLTVSSGSAVINQLVITNACGRFLKTGGTLSITTTNLAANLDADGDGLPNDWEQSHGLSPLDATGGNGASGDPDGDGYSNLQEYLAGSNPQSAASVPDAIWINSASGKWEVGGNWLIAVPPTNNQSVFITNASPKTVTIDTATPTNNMSIKNLTLSGVGINGNTLQITNTGTAAPLHISNNASITPNCILSLKNAAATVGTLFIDPFGSLFVTNGSVSTFSQQVQGEVSLVDSIVTNQPGGDINVASILTAELWMSGGSLVCDFSSVSIGGGGSDPGTTFGLMTVSNGFASVNELDIGLGIVGRGVGTLTCAGGTTKAKILTIGNGASSIGTVWVTGGQLVGTNVPTTTTIGILGGSGRITVSNGTVWLQSLAMGDYFSSGTIMINGGAVYATNVTLGTINCTGTGAVSVAGGSLFVTNAAFAATLEVRNGTVALNSGTLTVDRLVITNGCGHFVKTGGTLIQNNLPILGAGLDADGDGLPNDWEQAHGLDPLDPTGNNGATGDPDGDGIANLQEFQSGTDPQNPSSTPFRITSILQQGNDVLLTWATTGGKTNVVQATVGSSGSYSNSFADISGNIVPNVVGLTSATYLDIGAATNFPVRYYRVRLVP